MKDLEERASRAEAMYGGENASREVKRSYRLCLLLWGFQRATFSYSIGDNRSVGFYVFVSGCSITSGTAGVPHGDTSTEARSSC